MPMIVATHNTPDRAFDNAVARDAAGTGATGTAGGATGGVMAGVFDTALRGAAAFLVVLLDRVTLAPDFIWPFF